MKFFTLPVIALSSISCLFADLSEQADGVIVFKNGDRIAGSLQGKVNEGSAYKLKIGSPYFKDSSFIESQSLDYIVWDRERKNHEDSAIVKLQTGDVIYGKIAELRENDLLLTSIWSNEVKIDRQLIESIKFVNLGKLVYEGTTSLDGWSLSNKNVWSVQNGAFVTSESGGRISRDVKLPPKIRFSTEILSRNYTQLELKLWTADINTTGASFVNITFRGNSIKVDKYENGMFQSMANAVHSKERENFQLDLFIDRDADTYWIYVNGELLSQQNIEPVANDNVVAADAKPDAGNKTPAPTFGGTILFNFLSSGMGFKGLCISEWDGASLGEKLHDYELDTQKEKTDKGKENVPALKTGRVFLNNGDILEGKVTHEGDLIVVTSKLYTVKIPFNVISLLNIPPPPVNPFEPEEMAKKPQEIPPGLRVKVDLSDGSVITANLNEVKEDYILFTSPYTEEELSLPLEMVKKIVFEQVAATPPASSEVIKANHADGFGVEFIPLGNKVP